MQGKRSQSVSFSERKTPFFDALKVNGRVLVFSDAALRTRASRAIVSQADKVANVKGLFACKKNFTKETIVLSISGKRSFHIELRLVERPLPVSFLRMGDASILILVSVRRPTPYLCGSVL